MISLQFDGLFQEINALSSPFKAGLLGYGWLVLKDGALIARGYGVAARGKDATSSVAEYLALIEGLDALSVLGITDEPVQVSGDAKFVIDQMQGLSSVTSPVMKPLHRRASKLAARFDRIDWVWTPRRYNKNADALTRHAMKKIAYAQGDYQAAVKAIHPQNGPTTRLLPLVDLRVYQPLSAV